MYLRVSKLKERNRGLSKGRAEEKRCQIKREVEAQGERGFVLSPGGCREHLQTDGCMFSVCLCLTLWDGDAHFEWLSKFPVLRRCLLALGPPAVPPTVIPRRLRCLSLQELLQPLLGLLNTAHLQMESNPDPTIKAPHNLLRENLCLFQLNGFLPCLLWPNPYLSLS